MDQLIGSNGYLPLGYCFKWDTTLLVLTVVGNLLASIALFLIPLGVFTFLRRGGNYQSFSGLFYLFTSASIAGAAAHAMKIWNVFHSDFALEAGLDFYSGLAFLSTAALMWPLIPKILALPQPEQVTKAYEELKAEMIRRESAEYRNRQLASIVESSNDAIVSFLLNGTVLSWNRGAQELFGYSVESTMGKAMRQLIGPDMDMIIDVLREGRKLDTIELPYTTRDGRLIYLSLCVSPIKDAEGKVVSGAAIFRDITQTKQAEKDLVHASEQLSHSNKELEDFAWVAAHDLKEPVRTMATYSKLLSQEYEETLDEQAKQFLKFIHRSSIMAMARIDDVLKFSAVRREKFTAHKVDLNDLVFSVMQDLNSAIKESHAKIDIPKPLPTIHGKSEYVSLLMQNILSNAIKYSDKAPLIEITAEEEGEFWHIQVRDNGIGFEQEHASKIFQMFQRLHSDEKYSGTGLGLAMCKKIVELHGGKIWAESKVGEGTTFHFTLPSVDKLVYTTQGNAPVLPAQGAASGDAKIKTSDSVRASHVKVAAASSKPNESVPAAATAKPEPVPAAAAAAASTTATSEASAPAPVSATTTSPPQTLPTSSSPTAISTPVASSTTGSSETTSTTSAPAVGAGSDLNPSTGIEPIDPVTN